MGEAEAVALATKLRAVGLHVTAPWVAGAGRAAGGVHCTVAESALGRRRLGGLSPSRCMTFSGCARRRSSRGASSRPGGSAACPCYLPFQAVEAQRRAHAATVKFAEAMRRQQHSRPAYDVTSAAVR